MRADARRDAAFEAARMYYQQGQTMEAIASHLNISRSTVSRLLSSAREEGIVRVSLHAPGARRAGDLQKEVAEAFGVRVRVVPSAPEDTERERLDAVAAEGAALVQSLQQPDSVMGMAWGTTVAALVEAAEVRPVPGLAIVQLNGAINPQGSGLGYVSSVLAQAASSWGADVHLFPVPAFFDHPETREALWRERSVRQVLALQSRCRLAVFGVGAFDAEVPSHVYTSGYLSARDVHDLRSDGVVGDVCTTFLRSDGSWEDVPLNARGTGPTPADLARIPRRVLVAAGPRKAAPLRAALLAGCATDVVMDEVTATRLTHLG
ncbi:transcriptional regulator [Brachybacterium endophyticum]|uniref:Transcriptional regulator n=1 Tax=Brachybacterium endophyticum TaxID=2182385 RepID=A0A2U2RK27_9MICO|nr:sugar-binding domain-containing protein [Brachybacterium endophyticum]PWH06196.1 transcriptional regulator [Brachybacterium endophyticum]